jgi:hypothetical protein
MANIHSFRHISRVFTYVQLRSSLLLSTTLQIDLRHLAASSVATLLGSHYGRCAQSYISAVQRAPCEADKSQTRV